MQNNPFILILVLSAFCLNGCANRSQSMPALIKRVQHVDAPQQVHYNMQDALARFGKMADGYTGLSEDVLVEVDLIPNDSGNFKDLPSDLGYYVVSALSQMGPRFTTCRTYDSAPLAPASAGVSPAQLPASSRPKTTPTLKIRGQLLRVPERIVKGNEARGGVSAKIQGGAIDAQAGKDNEVRVRNLRVGLYLADAEGRSLPGPTATYDVWFFSNSSSSNFSLYFEGTGGGISGKTEMNQDAGDAAFDATSAAVIQLVGTALKLPYWRCSPLFAPDAGLQKSYRNGLATMTNRNLDLKTKQMLTCDGLPLDETGPELTAADREIVRREMRRRSLSPDRREDRESFLYARWQDMDYQRASGHVEQLLARHTRDAREQMDKVAAAAASGTASKRGRPLTGGAPPADAGELPGPDSAPAQPPATASAQPVVHFDLSRIADQNQRITILNLIKDRADCTGMRYAETGDWCEFAFHGQPGTLQLALGRQVALSTLRFVWKDRNWDQLVAVSL